MKKIQITQEMIHGCVSVEKDSAGHLIPWRIPFEQKKLFPSAPPDEALLDKTACAAGVRLRVKTHAQNIGLASVKGIFDLVINNELFESCSAGETESDIMFKTLPAGEKTLEIWLPQGLPVRLSHILFIKSCRKHVILFIFTLQSFYSFTYRAVIHPSERCADLSKSHACEFPRQRQNHATPPVAMFS